MLLATVRYVDMRRAARVLRMPTCPNSKTGPGAPLRRCKPKKAPRSHGPLCRRTSADAPVWRTQRTHPKEQRLARVRGRSADAHHARAKRAVRQGMEARRGRDRAVQRARFTRTGARAPKPCTWLEIRPFALEGVMAHDNQLSQSQLRCLTRKPEPISSPSPTL